MRGIFSLSPYLPVTGSSVVFHLLCQSARLLGCPLLSLSKQGRYVLYTTEP